MVLRSASFPVASKMAADSRGSLGMSQPMITLPTKSSK